MVTPNHRFVVYPKTPLVDFAPAPEFYDGNFIRRLCEPVITKNY